MALRVQDSGNGKPAVAGDWLSINSENDSISLLQMRVDCIYTCIMVTVLLEYIDLLVFL